MTVVLVASLATREDLEAARVAFEALPLGRENTLVLDAGQGAASMTALRDPVLLRLVKMATDADVAVHVVADPEAALPSALADVPRESSVVDALRTLLPMGSRTFQARVIVPARLDYLPPLREIVAEAIGAHHGSAEAFQVEILVDELCLNAAENSPSWTATYEVGVSCEGHELQVEVINTFDPATEPEQAMRGRLESFDDSGGYLGERGRGLFLIARIADGLQIRSLPGHRLRVIATKRLRAAPPDSTTGTPASS